MLLILKLLLTFVEDGADTSGNYVPIPKCAVFWYSEHVCNYELDKISRREDELVMLQSLQAEPRLLVCYGKPTTSKHMEIAGYAMGVVVGAVVSLERAQSSVSYYEVNVCGESPKDIKIGWAINGNILTHSLTHSLAY